MFCNRALWLDQGCLVADGPPADVTARYLQFLFGGQSAPASASAAAAPPILEEPPAIADAPCDGARPLRPLTGRPDLIRWGSGEIRITGVALDDGRPGCAPAFEHGARLHCEIEFAALTDVPSRSIGLGFSLRNTKGLDIIAYTSHDAGERLPPLVAGQRVRLAYEFDNILAPGQYALVVNVEDVVGVRQREYYDYVENALILHVASSRLIFSTVLPQIAPVGCRVTPAAERRPHDAVAP
jgi:lipopolysaccharide transport system ATP-binding protein